MVEIYHVFGAYSNSSFTTSVIKTTTETWRSERKLNVASLEECQKKKVKRRLTLHCAEFSVRSNSDSNCTRMWTCIFYRTLKGFVVFAVECDFFCVWVSDRTSILWRAEDKHRFTLQLFQMPPNQLLPPCLSYFYICKYSMLHFLKLRHCKYSEHSCGRTIGAKREKNGPLWSCPTTCVFLCVKTKRKKNPRIWMTFMDKQWQYLLL